MADKLQCPASHWVRLTMNHAGSLSVPVSSHICHHAWHIEVVPVNQQVRLTIESCSLTIPRPSWYHASQKMGTYFLKTNTYFIRFVLFWNPGKPTTRHPPVPTGQVETIISTSRNNKGGWGWDNGSQLGPKVASSLRLRNWRYSLKSIKVKSPHDL